MADLHFPLHARQQLQPYLPGCTPLERQGDVKSHQTESSSRISRPFITLTYAQSLDSQISLASGFPTALSGPSSKAMTHYLRSTHDAILIGSGTALADDPSLNCRLEEVVVSEAAFPEGEVGTVAQTDSKKPPHLRGQPRPVILDRRGRWDISPDSKVVKLANEGKGRAPWIGISNSAFSNLSDSSKNSVMEVGGKFLRFEDNESFSFDRVLELLSTMDITSVMVEGGATLINEILTRHLSLIDSLIVTIAPIMLGRGGVAILPKRQQDSQPAVKMFDVTYMPLDQDIVLCARIKADVQN